VVEAGVAEVLVDEEALGALDAAAEQLHQVLVLHLADEPHLVEELVRPLPRVEEEPLHGHLPAVRQHTLRRHAGQRPQPLQSQTIHRTSIAVVAIQYMFSQFTNLHIFQKGVGVGSCTL
jgi:hypothetical protein